MKTGFRLNRQFIVLWFIINAIAFTLSVLLFPPRPELVHIFIVRALIVEKLQVLCAHNARIVIDQVFFSTGVLQSPFIYYVYATVDLVGGLLSVGTPSFSKV